MIYLFLLAGLPVWLNAQQTALRPEPVRPLFITTGLPAQAFAGVEEVEIWLKSYSPALAEPGLDLMLSQRIESLTGEHLSWRLYWEGVAVFDASIKLRLDKQGRAVSLALQLPAENWPQLPRQEIMTESELRTKLVKSQGPGILELEPMWAWWQEGWLPVFRYRFQRDGQPLLDEWLIDARTGETLFVEDLLTYFQLPPGDTTGIGRVFDPNPCTVANVAYGVLFHDSLDQHKPIFDALMDTVLLRDIFWDEDSQVFRLQGPFVRLEKTSVFSFEPATSTDGTFFFRRDQTGFEEVMAYFHLDRYQRYVQGLGFMNLQNKPLPVDAHGYTSDVSAFVPNAGNSYLFFGTGNVDDAEDADVLIHEYAHALSYAAAPETRSGAERRGLEEGIADYVAAAHSFDITPNRWELLFDWDGHNEFWSGRIANTAEVYPPASSSIYAYGSIWASLLMKIRFEIGATVCDRLVIESFYGFFGGMTMQQAGRYLIQTDSLLYGGAHRQTIRRYLCEHNIDSDPMMPCLVVSVPEEAMPVSWEVFPNPGDGNLQIRWEARPGSRVRVQLFDLQGKQLKEETTNGTSLEWQLALPAGCYVIQWEEGSRKERRKIILLR